MNIEIENTPIDGCFLIKSKVFKDERGFFTEIYKSSEFKKLDLPVMNQDNFLMTNRGGIRAMHWQTQEAAQSKLVKVLCGEIFDVVFDLRKNSKTYLKHLTFNLHSESAMLFVPQGCAHGFQGISETSLVVYKTDTEYQADRQASFRWNDTDAGINWPISQPILSIKDANAPLLSQVLR